MESVIPKSTVLLVPSDVVTLTVLVPVSAIGSIVNVAVAEVIEPNAILLTVTPVPFILTDNPDMKFVPVKVIFLDSPVNAVFGERDVNVSDVIGVGVIG